MQTLVDRNDRENELIAAGEVLDLRFRDGGKALSLRAGKLFHLLIQAAGAKALDDVEHSVPIAELNFPHVERDELVECVRDLVGTTVELRTRAPTGGDEIMLDPLLFGVRRPADIHEEAGNLVFRLSPTLRKVLEKSNHWAALSRKAVLAFESRYALRLYEIVALRSGLEHKHTETFSLADLRRRLGVAPKTFDRWQDFRRFVLGRAVAEVNQLSGFAVSYEPVKKGRAFAAVRLTWGVQGKEARAAVARELEASRVGRKARREGKVEEIIDEPADAKPEAPKPSEYRPFPPVGPIYNTKWADVVREHAPKPTPDVDRVGAAFQKHVRDTNQRFDAGNIEQHFINFCRKWQA